jgi:hypothetical protein
MVILTKQIRVLALAGVLALVWHGTAAAQSDDSPLFVTVNIGGQSHTHSFSTAGSQTVYGEDATFASSQGVSGGLLIDIGADYRIRPKFALGVSYSTVGDTESATLTASVPNPIFFDQPAIVSGEQGNLGRRETAVHIQAKILIPTGTWLPDNGWLALVVGPTFFHLSQDLISSIDVPTGTQSAVAGVENQGGSGIGFNGGFELRYPLTTVHAMPVGIGGFIRYAGGKVDLASVSGAKVGGFQAAAGVNVGF